MSEQLVLITGADGFIGKNLSVAMDEIGIETLLFKRGDAFSDLNDRKDDICFVFHLAGENRPKNDSEFKIGNVTFTEELIDWISNSKVPPAIFYSSSAQVGNESEYANTKHAAENIIIEYGKKASTHTYICRLPSVFGKWSKPNYNTVIATWCHNISRDLDVFVSDKKHIVNLCYIDDVISMLSNLLKDKIDGYKEIQWVDVQKVYQKNLGEIYDLINQYESDRHSGRVGRIGVGFERALYATYLSFLPSNKFAYKLTTNIDDRGGFTEILKTVDSGQMSISITKPGITRGNHYHFTKNEKFIVVKGDAQISLRNINSADEIIFSVNGNKLQVVEMIPGYTHKIKNTGQEDMILLLWANEEFDPENPDTYFKDV